MFKQIFFYWKNNVDTPSVIIKYNLWFFINIKIFKFKIYKNIFFFFKGLNSLKIRKLNFFFKKLLFENYYYSCFKYFLIFIIISVILFI